MAAGQKMISSNFRLFIDGKDNLLSFEFSKLPCSQPITDSTAFRNFCVGKKIHNLLLTRLEEVLKELKGEGTEEQFFIYIEWSALRSILCKYLAVDSFDVDEDRCLIESVDHNEGRTVLQGILLPPKEM